MDGQLTFEMPDDGAPPGVAFLTIARGGHDCALLRAHDPSGDRQRALRAGRVAAVDGHRGGYRIRPADLETWMYGNGA